MHRVPACICESEEMGAGVARGRSCGSRSCLLSAQSIDSYQNVGCWLRRNREATRRSQSAVATQAGRETPFRCSIDRRHQIHRWCIRGRTSSFLSVECLDTSRDGSRKAPLRRPRKHWRSAPTSLRSLKLIHQWNAFKADAFVLADLGGYAAPPVIVESLTRHWAET